MDANTKADKQAMLLIYGMYAVIGISLLAFWYSKKTNDKLMAMNKKP